MAVYLSSHAPTNLTSVVGLQGSRSTGGTISTSLLVGGVGFGRQHVGCVPPTQGLVSVGGFPWSRPLGGVLPTSSFVGGMDASGQLMGGISHAKSWDDLVPSLGASFPGLPPTIPTTGALSPVLQVYRSLHLASPTSAVLSPSLGILAVGALMLLGSSAGLMLPPTAFGLPPLLPPLLHSAVLTLTKWFCPCLVLFHQVVVPGTFCLDQSVTTANFP
jgi:hypothetical protein